jgi:hypothetical protein
MRWIALGAAGLVVWLAATFAVVAAVTQDDESCAKAAASYAATHNEYEFALERGDEDKAGALRDLEIGAWDEMFRECSIDEPITLID